MLRASRFAWRICGGKVVVLNFVFVSCTDVCPVHAEEIAKAQAIVNSTPMKERVAFVTITTDPKRDTPEVLRGYAGDHGLDPANWQFLTSGPGQPEDSTRKLAEAFGHKFKPTEDGMQLHGVVTHVIDQDGMWRGNFHGLNFKTLNLVTFVNALTNMMVPHEHPENEASFWDSVRSFF
jgi:protein SCO1